MKFLNTEEMKVEVDKLDQFIEFRVKGVENWTRNFAWKKRWKRAEASDLKAKSLTSKKIQIKLEDRVFADDPVSTKMEDYKEKNIEEKVDDVVNELVEEDDHDEDIDMVNWEAEDDDDLVDEADVQEKEQQEHFEQEVEEDVEEEMEEEEEEVREEGNWEPGGSHSLPETSEGLQVRLSPFWKCTLEKKLLRSHQSTINHDGYHLWICGI